MTKTDSDLTKIYCDGLPEIICRLCETSPMERLSHIGMDCGCEYTSFPVYLNLPSYTRYMHSLGVASIVWNFTKDLTQTAASLFHDIATPVFAHTIDFLNGDHLKQESTENRTEELIKTDREICEILKKSRISPDDVTDYHKYPVADNDSPALSADRLEYTLVNSVRYKILSEKKIREIYEDIYTDILPGGKEELSFRTGRIAEEFAFASLTMGKIYEAKEDRYSMQTLANLVKDAVDARVILPTDLYTTEENVIKKLQADDTIRRKWDSFRALSKIIPAEKAGTSGSGLVVPAKKRYIDPLIEGKVRVTMYSKSYGNAVAEYLQADHDEMIFAE